MNIFRRLLHPFGVARFAPHDPSIEKMSTAIRRGVEMGICETRFYRGCAIGTAYTAKTGETLNAQLNPCSDVAHQFNVPEFVVERASAMHWSGASREQVADWLEKQGY